MTAPAAHRVGHPTPLAFHLGSAVSAYLQAVLAAPRAGDPDFPWHPGLSGYSGPPPDPLEVTAEAARRMGAMLEGITRWQCHPYRRDLPEPPMLWADGSSRVLDYGAVPEARDPAGPVVLVVPSLINRAYVLDLMADRSFLRALAAEGLRPLLLDWGAPGHAEARFDLGDYIEERLTPALEVAKQAGGRAPALLGYCMGGTICAMHALARPGLRALVTIGAPWDFDATQGLPMALRGAARHYGTARLRQVVRTLAQAFGAVPAEAFQHLFAMIDPIQAARKFRRFAALEQNSAAARHFVALEDWLADGVPMAGPAAETLLVDWLVESAPSRNRWPLAAAAHAPPPALIVTGQRDTIAQPAMAAPLEAWLPGARRVAPGLGHVGMVTGAAAPQNVWRPVVEFLRATA